MIINGWAICGFSTGPAAFLSLISYYCLLFPTLLIHRQPLNLTVNQLHLFPCKFPIICGTIFICLLWVAYPTDSCGYVTLIILFPIRKLTYCSSQNTSPQRSICHGSDSLCLTPSQQFLLAFYLTFEKLITHRFDRLEDYLDTIKKMPAVIPLTVPAYSRYYYRVKYYQ